MNTTIQAQPERKNIDDLVQRLHDERAINSQQNVRIAQLEWLIQAWELWQAKSVKAWDDEYDSTWIHGAREAAREAQDKYNEIKARVFGEGADNE